MAKEYSEDALVEQPAIALFAQLGWQTQSVYSEKFGADASDALDTKSTLGREHAGEVFLRRDLRAALVKLNPDTSTSAIEDALDEITRDRSTLGAASANQEIYELLKNGVGVSLGEDAQGDEERTTLRIIDWETPANNHFRLLSQFWVTGEIYKRRADLVGFVNGVPLVFVELKAAHKNILDAFENNLKDYKDTIPHLFTPNAFILLSNGSQTHVGTLTAGWEHFATWKKINEEGEEGVISLETAIRGMCEPARLLDLVENFIVYQAMGGKLTKILAKNHQYLGVNNAIRAVQDLKENQGRLGVFWHTQGSGKSLSMVFFSQKVTRKLAGNWTFVVITDRDDLDGQIYKAFADTGAIIEAEKDVRAQNGAHLRQLLSEDHRYVFTLIQKFHTQSGAKYPKLSDRSNIIVMTDEAHRSQYDTFALNMRTALPNAAFIGFTGTPLMGNEEKTRDVFGEYVSVYNFAQAIEDNATVPLYYENRIPELQLTNEELNIDMAQVLDEAELSPEQEDKLEREFAREYHLLTREDRLDTIAKDLVAHFMGRVPLAKAMVVSIDKATAVKTFDRVQAQWKIHLADLRQQLADLQASLAADASTLGAQLWLEKQISWMEATDMAVVISSSQNEVAEFHKKGLEILPHRKRMVQEDLESKFKDAGDPLRIVFVCAMWMTGFDVPSCSTIYLDKPMRNHTLMQTIARANRVFPDKYNGLIVDYVGVFRNLQKALDIYGKAKNGKPPAMPKSELVAALRTALQEMQTFCTPLGIDAQKAQDASGFARIKLMDDALEALVGNEERKRKYLSLANTVNRLFRAILPEASANEFAPPRHFYVTVADKIRALDPDVDISPVLADVEALLDLSVAADAYLIRASGADALIDLSEIDFDKIQRDIPPSRRKTEAEKLAGAINAKLKKMVRLNKSRLDYQEKFQKMIDEYNVDSSNVEEHLKRLAAFTHELSEEEQRALKENLSEAELAVFDLLTRPDVTLSPEEEKQVKTVAHELLQTLENEKLSLDWRKRQQSRAQVRLSIEEILDKLPAAYSTELYEQKCGTVFQHVYDSYYGAARGIYATGA